MNIISIIWSLTNIVFVNTAYQTLLSTAFLKNQPAYSDVWHKSGTSGRIILQLIAANVNPKVFEHVLNDLVNLLRKGIDSDLTNFKLNEDDDLEYDDNFLVEEENDLGNNI